MNFFSSKEKTTLSFVFDIRDTSVTIAAARLEKGKKPELVACQNLKIDIQDSSDHKKYLASMLKTLDKGILSVRKSVVNIGNKGSIGKYFFFIGSPWSVSESKMIKVLKDKVFEIDKSFLEKIISSEENEEKIQIEKNTDISEWGVLEEKIIQSKLNGYKADTIFGKKTKDLEIELFVSFIPKDLKDKLSVLEDGNIQKYRSGRLNSCILSSYSFLRDLYSDKNDFIYIDIGDLITDTYVVKNDAIEAVVSIPIGKKDIVRSTSIKTKTPEDVLLSALHINHREHASNLSKTKGVMGSGVKLWLEKLNEAVSLTCAEINMPKNIFILINDELTNILVKEIKESMMSVELNMFDKDSEITNIEESIVDSFITNGKIYKNAPYIKMDLVFLDKTLINQ